MSARNRAFFALFAASSAACSILGNDDSASSELSLVTTVQCSIARGAFVARSSASADGIVSVQCPGSRGVALNGEPLAEGGAASFSIKPREGVNVLHVERGEGAEIEATDIPFLFGTFKDARGVVPDAVAVRIGAAGMSSGPVRLPLPAGPSPLNLSQVASQVVRDQGNVLARYDGTRHEIGGFGFFGATKVKRSTYDHKNFTAVVTPRAGGVHVEADIASVTSVVGWEVGVAGLSLGDEVTANIAKVHAGADVDFTFDPATKALRGRLRAPDLRVEGVDLDSAALGRIPFGLADGLEDAISAGVEGLVNGLASPLLEVISGTLVPDLALTVESLKLPKKVALPVIGGSVELAQSFDGATFDAAGSQVSLAAGVMAPAKGISLPAPGFLSRGSARPTFDRARPFGASLSVDYVNQALFAVWKQGLLNRQLTGPISQFGISTDAIISNAKLPPVVFPSADGSGLLLHLGEIELTTVFHSATAGDAKVRIAVTLLAGAKIELTDGGATLTIKPTNDDTTTKFVAELVGVPSGDKAAAAELAGIVTMFSPVLEAVIAHDFELPPIALPGIDLGVVTPGFAGRQGRLDGVLRFDAAASRIGVEGNVVAF